MAGGGGNDSKGIYDVNMTPLIDVSLVLVVILLVATPMALQSSILLQKSGASTSAATPPPELQRVMVSIESEDEVVLNGETIARRDLRARLRPLVAASTAGPVVVLCSPEVKHGTFVEVLDEAKQSGAKEIAVVGRPGHASR
jgi:biopolymer transport protein ExbD